MRDGIESESNIVKAFENETGQEVYESGFLIEQFSNDSRKAKPKQLRTQSKAQAIVIFSQPQANGIHEVKPSH